MNKLIYFILPVTLAFMACKSKKQEPAAARENTTTENLVQLTDAQLQSAAVELTQLAPKNIAYTLHVSGKIDVPPQNMVSISFPLGGFLKDTRLLSGMQVTKGEAIATMEDPQYIQLQQDYLTARTKLDLLAKDYIRQKDLNSSKAASDKVFEQAEADYKSQQIQVSALAQKLKLIGVNAEKLDPSTISRTVNIYSPINGFVTAVNVNIGKYVNPTDVLFEIVDPSDIHLGLTVFEKDIPSLSKGQKVIAYTNTDPSKKYECAIILIGQDVGNNRSVEVHCHFEQYDKSLLPGTFMNADIETKNKQVQALPEAAVVANGGQQYVFVAHDKHTFEMVPVKTGGRENGFLEIQADDAATLAGKNIVAKGAYSLLMKVKNGGDEE
ncbi:efflux transporter periplasmic adaptor subunit [Chitinophaga parva]|uniref:Efflux transporter periplasmic adaptor subunit n=1 Tax=Chitinophaga parva TaxID=2169414 RepID=A0A2T7BBQ8_9BACT|nr:efflux RND transporter periplasmic adaptor subunit [Chitinophaga parva]PUZ21829.1 efflux transporter periplasmic adaptor subunit [Chitinophaga parva]